MPTMRLKENHPAMQALEELSRIAEDLGISIDFYGTRTIISYRSPDGKVMDYDWLDTEDNNTSPRSFPYGTETKLTYEKP